MAARRIVMLGPPGSGKGTYSRLLAESLAVPHHSTGDMLRAEIVKGSAIGAEAANYTTEGKQVPSSLVSVMVKASIDRSPGGWILDGFPRSVSQAEALSRMATVDRVVAISMRRDLLIRKLFGRRLCPECGVAWNIESIDEDGIAMPPMLPSGQHNGDPCGAHCMPKLTSRDDDREDVIVRRLQLWGETENDLISFYNASTVDVTHIEILGGVEKMLPAFKTAVGLNS
mmetsp:Transcript_34819/g.91151  ORF Transcript_34819/g.91151 Transcript_34819/m.91151 type:complete len:228 (+) Transcript_34819:259-942(+)